MCMTASARLNLTDSLIAGNSAKSGGGGLALFTNATAHLDRVAVRDNRAEGGGGGMHLGNLSSAVTTNSRLYNNTCGNNGGALSVCEHASCLIISTEISFNLATGHFGGGLYADGAAKVRLVGSSVTNNQADGGGGVFIANVSRVVGQGLLIKDNTATANGGGANAEGNSSLLLIASNISANNAAKGGGVVVLENASCEINHCMLKGNMADGGGGLNVGIDTQGHVRLHHSTLHSNVAIYGGGILANTALQTPAAQAVACTFVNNSAGSDGGAIYLGGRATVILTGQTRVTNNQATSYGGFASVNERATLVTTDGHFDDNCVGVDGHGGLVFAAGQAVLAFKGGYAQGCMHPRGLSGGAFCIDGNATLNMTSCTLSGMHAERGGCIAAYGSSSIYARDCVADNCTAVWSGGGLHVASTGQVSWVGGTFSNMRAQEGAAINILDGTLSLADILFTNATAEIGGGAILADETAHVFMMRCSVHACTSEDQNGGGMYMKGNAEVYMADCNISRCSSNQWGGGALAAQANSSVQLHRCHLHHNKANTAGGAIHQIGASRVVANMCSITDNACRAQGGGVAATGNTSVQLHHSAVLRNVADVGGGIALGGAAAIVMDDTRVELNIAARGGGVALGSSMFSLAQLQRSVHNNKAQSGGNDIFVEAISLTTTNSTVEGFVSRLGTDAGLVNMSFLVTGHQGVPAEGFVVVAVLDDVVLQNGMTNADGRVNLPVKLRKPPGVWSSLAEVVVRRVYTCVCIQC